MLEISPPGLTGRGLETGPQRSYTGTKLEAAEAAKGHLRGTARVPTLPGTRLEKERRTASGRAGGAPQPGVKQVP